MSKFSLKILLCNLIAIVINLKHLINIYDGSSIVLFKLTLSFQQLY